MALSEAKGPAPAAGARQTQAEAPRLGSGMSIPAGPEFG